VVGTENALWMVNRPLLVPVAVPRAARHIPFLGVVGCAIRAVKRLAGLGRDSIG
jgi:hypothetical protein